jgi:ABC-type multidrug transport system fused ATPase/permease subunit
VSFELRRERITALVGPSGSGKSTIANLLMRFYDLPAGMILIDGIDIREYSIRSLRQAFSIISQDTVLLNETLRVNLLFGVDREVGARELESAIEEARLEDVVAMLPGGLDGQVGERGAQLSGGQRQRVAIARAMLRRSSLLILDEATSALDSITENLVQEAIGNAMRLCTALVIAHRFSTIKLADHVVVLDGGRVVQQGQFPEMRAADGLFKDMCEKQMLV